MGVYAEYDALAIFKMSVHPLDPVGKNIRSRHLHGRGKVDDHRIFLCRPPRLLHRRTNLQREIQFRPGKTLRRVLQHDLSRELLRPLLHHLRTLYGYIYDLLPVHAEHHIPLQCGRGIIDMDDRLLTALDRLESSVDQFFTALRQNLHQHIVRYQFPVHKLPQKVIFDLACRGKTDLDLLEAHLHQILKHLDLFRHDHRIDQSLITVPQIHRTPDRSFSDLEIRPFPLRIVHHRILLITLVI